MDIEPAAKGTQTDTARVLLHYTLLISESEIKCGNCGEIVEEPRATICTTCAVAWLFSGITYPTNTSMQEQALLVEKLMPALNFIGQVDTTGVCKAYLPWSFS